MEEDQKKPIKVGPEKVANMVATFLNKDCDGFHIIQVTTTKTASEKVASTVATFCSYNIVH
jgi:hypothetical protein